MSYYAAEIVGNCSRHTKEDSALRASLSASLGAPIIWLQPSIQAATASSIWIRVSSPRPRSHRPATAKSLKKLARPKRFELLTPRFVVWL